MVDLTADDQRLILQCYCKNDAGSEEFVSSLLEAALSAGFDYMSVGEACQFLLDVS